MLHRNGGNLADPQAVVAVDRSPDAQGSPSNQSLGVVEVCAGATEMKWGDAGRGPRLYVVCFEAGQVYVVDPENVVVTGVINVGRGPAVLTFSDEDPNTAYRHRILGQQRLDRRSDRGQRDREPGDPADRIPAAGDR